MSECKSVPAVFKKKKKNAQVHSHFGSHTRWDASRHPRLKKYHDSKTKKISTKEDCEASLYKVFLKEESEDIRFERTEKGNVMLISEYSEMLKKYVAYAQCVPLTFDNK